MEKTASAKRRYCLKCGYDAETAEVLCPNCRRRLRTTTETRLSGFFQAFGGAILIGLMGYISLWLIEQTNQGRFTGTQQQLYVIVGIFALVILFGFVSFVAGAWQLIVGKRNKVFIWIVALLSFVLLGGALYVIWKF